MNTQYHRYSTIDGHEGHSDSFLGRLPKLHFPKFDGDNPKLWLSRTADFMKLYRVPQVSWVKLASMQIIAPAARWLPSVEHKLKSCSWEQFVQLVLDRFSREHHELLVRQFLHIRQTSSVADYIDCFSELADQLIAYESRPDPLYFTMRFIDGLSAELRVDVLIHRPPDLDTAFVLAQLQEEVAPLTRGKDVRKFDSWPQHKQFGSSPLLLLAPPKVDKQAIHNADVIKGADTARARQPEDRWNAIRAQRRAQGLYQFCAEKWSRGHTCADRIQLHAVQELWEAFHLAAEDSSVQGDSIHDEQQLFLTLSTSALTGQQSLKSFCLQGSVQGQTVNILLDSGSSHTFISAAIASRLSGVVEIPSPVRVKVANGEILQCESFLPAASWRVNEYEFQGDLRVISLSSYDMILGLDRLEQFSPMKVHWLDRWLAIPYKGSTVILHGDLNGFPHGTVVQLCSE